MGRKTKFKPFNEALKPDTNKEHETKEVPLYSHPQSRGGRDFGRDSRDAEREPSDLGGSWRDRPRTNQPRNYGDRSQVQYKREGEMPGNQLENDDVKNDADETSGAWRPKTRRFQSRNYRNHDDEKDEGNTNDDSMKPADNQQSMWRDRAKNETTEESRQQRNYERNQQSDEVHGQKYFRNSSYNRNRDTDGYQRDSTSNFNRNRNEGYRAWDRDNDRSNSYRSRNTEGFRDRDNGGDYRRTWGREGNQNRDRDNGSESNYRRTWGRDGNQDRDRERDSENWRHKSNDNRTEKHDNYPMSGRGGRRQFYSKQSESRVEREPSDGFRGSNVDGPDIKFQRNTNSTTENNSSNNWNVETTNEVTLPDMNDKDKTWESDYSPRTQPSASGVTTVEDSAEITSPGSSSLNPHAQSFHLQSSPNTQSWNEIVDDDGNKDNFNQSTDEKSIEFDMKTQCAINENEDIESKGSKILNKSNVYDDKRSGSQWRGRKSYSTDIDDSLPRDEEYDEYRKYRDSRKIEYTRVVEVEKDLFSVGPEYALAHCVAEDMKMGSGIAVQFCQTFKNRGELLEQRKKQGDVAVLTVPIEDSNDVRYIYYMVTKRISEGKPTYGTLWSSIKKMREHIKQENVKKLAIPRIGCGLDRLEWDYVKPMLEFAFRDVDLEILVCNFQQEESTSPSSRTSGPRQSLNKSCRIVHEPRSITEIEPYTIILYFATKDGQITPAMSELDKKFPYLPEFKRAPKNLGENVRFEHKNGDYLLYGCVVGDKKEDPISFIYLEKCLRAIQKENRNRKEKYEYVAFQRFDDGDETINEKILGLMKGILRDVNIHCCAAPKKE